MKARNKGIFAVAAALVALSLLVVGCGGGTTDGDGGDTAKTTVTIGVGAPLTQGVVAFGQGLVRGATLAVEQANALPEVQELGLTFTIAEGDDQGDPKTGVNVANQFVANSSLIGVVGHFNSGVSIPASKVYNDAGIVMISPGSTNPTLTQQGFNNVFRTCTTDDVQGPTGAKYMIDLGMKTVFVVDDSTPYGEGLAKAFADEFVALGGTVAGTEKTSDKDSDFTSLVTKMKGTNPDLVFYGGLYNAGALLAAQVKGGGMTAPVMGGDGLADAEFINIAQDAAEGCFATSVGYPVEQLPKGPEFVSAFEAKFPGENISPFDAYGYDAAWAIIYAAVEVAGGEVGAAGLSSPAGRTAIIEAVAASNFEGATGPVSFDEKGDTNNKVITLYKAVDGVWVAQ